VLLGCKLDGRDVLHSAQNAVWACDHFLNCSTLPRSVFVEMFEDDQK